MAFMHPHTHMPAPKTMLTQAISPAALHCRMEYSVELVRLVDSIIAHARYTANVSWLTTPEIIACVMIKKGAYFNMGLVTSAAFTLFPTFRKRMERESGIDNAVSPHLTLVMTTALQSYDVEFHRRDPAARSFWQVKFGITERAARFLFRDRLCPRPLPLHLPRASLLKIMKTDYFSRLPVELKTLICDYVLRLPDSGVMIDIDFVRTQGTRMFPNAKKQASKTLVTLSRDFNDGKKLTEWSAHAFMNITQVKKKGLGTFVTPLAPLLSLLAVNKELHDIGTKIFYGKNHFHAWSMSQLSSLLSPLPDYRKKLLRKISVRLLPGDAALAEKIFRSKKLRALQEMGLIVRDKHDWEGFNTWVGKKVKESRVKYEEGRLVGVEGTKALCAMGQKVKISIEGDWKEFAQFIRDNSQVGVVTFKGIVVNKHERWGGEESSTWASGREWAVVSPWHRLHRATTELKRSSVRYIGTGITHTGQ